jgi:formate C-acetyltransferase
VRSERVERLRKAYFDACPEVCIERPELVTKRHRELGLFKQSRISALDKARVYRWVLEHRAPIVWHSCARTRTGHWFEFDGCSAFAGSTTSRFKGVLLYPEFMALALWPELHTVSRRAANPYQLDQQDAEKLNKEIFPAWLDRTILERARADAASLPIAERPDFSLLQYMVFFLTSKPECISHTIPDFSRAVSEGLRAVINDAAGHAAGSAEPERSFYAAIVEVMEGVIRYSNRLAERAEAMAAIQPDPKKRLELAELARIHRCVPEKPARTFREGLTTIWMCWIACHLENPNVGLSLGRLDQLLYPLYRSDIEKGVLTVDDAVELCCCLWLKIGDHVPMVPQAGEQLFGGTGSNQAITLGGVDTRGNDAVNDLTYVLLRATELMELRDPNLNARYMQGVNTRDYLRRLCQVNLDTRATPALHNDRAVIQALRAVGDDLEQARDYGIVGCVEPASNGRTYGHSGAILLNLTSALELTLFNGCHRHTGLDRRISVESGDPAQFRGMGELRTAFERQVRWLADEAVKINNALGRAHQAYYPTPILSALFEGPMKNGRDLIEGGATINSSGVAIVGLADTADSLSAIHKVVFEERQLSLNELITAVRDDFKNHAALRARLMNPAKTPKWGNEDPIGDGSVHWLVKLLHEVFFERKNYRGGRYRVGYWTMTNHAGFGRLMRASPNGRGAGENFASGFTPVSGVTPELPAVLNSVAGVPAHALSNGVAFNLKFTPHPSDPSMLDTFVHTVDAYFSEQGQQPGGMEIQFNVTRREDFIEAAKHPELHPELLVRVSGYTAYFKDLTPQMQEEIISRSEYELATGTATRPAVIHLDSTEAAC